MNALSLPPFVSAHAGSAQIKMGISYQRCAVHLMLQNTGKWYHLEQLLFNTCNDFFFFFKRSKHTVCFVQLLCMLVSLFIFYGCLFVQQVLLCLLHFLSGCICLTLVYIAFTSINHLSRLRYIGSRNHTKYFALLIERRNRYIGKDQDGHAGLASLNSIYLFLFTRYS